MRPIAPIEAVHGRAYTIPTDAPEADGTSAWDKTTLIVVTLEAGGGTGVRIEHMLFDGAPVPDQGTIRPDLSKPGLGLDFRWQDAERYAA